MALIFYKNILMGLTYNFLRWLITFFLIIGCTTKEKKNMEDASPTPSLPKNFERAIPPALIINPNERAGYMITHYWDHFDFTDTMYCHAPDITEQAFVDFITLFPHASYNKVTEGVQKLLTAAETDVVMYNYFFQKAEHYLYNPNSSMRNDEYFIPFLEQAVASTQVMDEYKIRPRQLLQLAYRNRPGAKAEDIVYTTASGKTDRLYALSASCLLLMFHNPDCHECKVTTGQLINSVIISSAVTSGKLKVLAIYPDEDIAVWREHLNDLPASWINGYDKTLVIRNNQTYDLKAIPTLYLLDENKTVILKDTSVGILQNFLEQNIR